MRRGLDSYSGLIVGGVRMEIKQTEVDLTGSDTARCECGSTLDFGTDLNGYVVETCATCKYTRTMQQVRPRAQTEVQVVLDHGQTCIGDAEVDREFCGEWVGWSGSGPRRRKCTVCTNERQRLLSREWQRKHKKPKKAA